MLGALLQAQHFLTVVTNAGSYSLSTPSIILLMFSFSLEQGSKYFSAKKVNVLGFVGHLVCHNYSPFLWWHESNYGQ